MRGAGACTNNGATELLRCYLDGKDFCNLCYLFVSSSCCDFLLPGEISRRISVQYSFTEITTRLHLSSVPY